MPPKPGNAFAQQKDLQRQQEKPEAKNREEDVPDSPMTTMSMFIPPDLTPIGNQVPAELSTPANASSTSKHATGRRKQGQRAFTDPTATVNAQSAAPSEPSAVSKQSGGFNYIKSKFAGKSRKNKDPEMSAQSYTKPASSGNQSRTPGGAIFPTTRRDEIGPEAVPTTTMEDSRGQNHPAHLSTLTMRTVSTPESRYVSLLQNDAMILGNNSMSPTHSGSYAMTGYPTIVTTGRPSIMSFEASVHGASSRESGGTIDPSMVHAPFPPSGYYDNSYMAPLPPPPGDEFQGQLAFHHQLPIYLAQQPHHRIGQTNLGGRQIDRSNYEAVNSGTWEQLHAQHPSTMPQFSPSNLQPFRQENSGSHSAVQVSDGTEKTEEQRKEARLDSLYNADATDSKSENGKEVLGAEIVTLLRGSLRRSASFPELRNSSSQVDSPDRTPVPKRMYKPMPQHPQYQARSSFEEQLAGGVFSLHQHLEAVEHSLSRLIELCQIDQAFMPQFRQLCQQFRELCIQSNASRDYLQRIHLQTANLTQNIVGEVMSAMGHAVSAQLDALEKRLRDEQTWRFSFEKRMREEYNGMNQNILAVKKSVYASQRHMDEMNRKLDLLLQAQGVNAEKELTEQPRKIEEEKKDVTTTGALEPAAPPPEAQLETSPTRNRKPTPFPAKPVMAATLTSRPPHVPQFPHSLPSSSSFGTVTITDPKIPSPSSVSNARRIRHGHHREEGEARKENRRAGPGLKGLAEVEAMEPGTQVHPALRKGFEEQGRWAGLEGKGVADATAVTVSEANLHPALLAHHQEMIKRAQGKKEQQSGEEKDGEAAGEEVLWRKPSGDGEIGSTWYKAATQE